MNTLTRAEEQVMQALWKVESGFLGDIVKGMPDPRPHSNTVATILKILIEKEFVDIEVYSRMHKYFPLVTKQNYSRSRVKSLVKKYFDGSFSNIVSFMIKDNDLSIEDLELLLKQVKKEKKKSV